MGLNVVVAFQHCYEDLTLFEQSSYSQTANGTYLTAIFLGRKDTLRYIFLILRAISQIREC
jgi:hypothetical protein